VIQYRWPKIWTGTCSTFRERHRPVPLFHTQNHHCVHCVNCPLVNVLCRYCHKNCSALPTSPPSSCCCESEAFASGIQECGYWCTITSAIPADSEYKPPTGTLFGCFPATCTSSCFCVPVLVRRFEEPRGHRSGGSRSRGAQAGGSKTRCGTG